MPKTSIIRRTWHCTGCGYEADRLVGVCSSQDCKGTIYEETDPAKCGSMTVIGLEDIEVEIGNINKGRASRGQVALALVEAQAYRDQRMAEVNVAIAAIKLREKKA